MIKKVNIYQKLDLIQDFWNPRIVGELNDQQIRLVKLKGEFTFHKHDDGDEMFLVIKGSIVIDFGVSSMPLKVSNIKVTTLESMLVKYIS